MYLCSARYSCPILGETQEPKPKVNIPQSSLIRIRSFGTRFGALHQRPDLIDASLLGPRKVRYRTSYNVRGTLILRMILPIWKISVQGLVRHGPFHHHS